METNLPFKLFANCIPVRGAKRSTICDLQRNIIKLIPNDLYDFIKNYEYKSITVIKDELPAKHHDVIDEYFEFLLSNEFIFFTIDPEIFPELSLKWFEPSIVNNAILDINIDSSYNIKSVLTQLDNLLCKNLELRFFKDVNFENLIRILKWIDFKGLGFHSIDFLIKYSDEISSKRLLDLIKKFPRISSFKVFGAKENKIYSSERIKKGFIIYSKSKIKSAKSCGLISSSFFTPNIKAFSESVSHNSCLNGKISVDEKGFIKNCPSFENNFGHVNDIMIKESIESAGFKKYWNITKDEIATCRDCEFRYVCTDCRAYTEQKDFKRDIDVSKPLKCGYDPYTNKWEEWSLNPIKKEIIEHYGLQEVISCND